MLINTANLKTLYTGYSALFQRGAATPPQDHLVFTEETTSTTGEEEYPWLGEMPGMKKWLGDRVVNNLKGYGYKIANEDFEDTVQVPRNAILDDKYGAYNKPIEALGRAAAVHPTQLSFAQLALGFTTACYDGQFMFDTDHPVLDANGSIQSVANTDGGAGPKWFLIARNALVKPIILQRRQEPNFVALDNPEDANVFFRKQFIYGVDDRKGSGFGLWQGIWGSGQALTPANYANARSKMIGMKGDYGRPLGLGDFVLLVDSSNEGAANKVAKNTLGANGESNEWAGTAEVMVSSWL